jgi:cytochrome P450
MGQPSREGGERLSSHTQISHAVAGGELYDPLYHTPQDDVYDIYALLRREHPVYYNGKRGVWCLTRHSDVQAAARDWRVFATAPGVDLDAPNHSGPGDFIDADPPRHDVLRNVVRRYFVPSAIAELSAAVSRRVESIIRDLREREEVDLARDFAWRLPSWVICRLLGLPPADDDHIEELVLNAFAREPGRVDVPEYALSALRELREYLADLAAVKRKQPDDGILSGIVAGEPDAPTPTETVGMAMMFFIAGTETTFALIGNALNLLCEHRDARRSLIEFPNGIDPAIEEAVRFEAPVQYLARTTKEPATLQGGEIPAGERVILIFAAANRDAARWPEPDAFDIGRQPQRHLGFGEGIHFCIGAPLARLEARLALPAFIEAFPEYEVGAKRRLHSHIVRGWERLEADLGTPRPRTR